MDMTRWNNDWSLQLPSCSVQILPRVSQAEVHEVLMLVLIYFSAVPLCLVSCSSDKIK